MNLPVVLDIAIGLVFIYLIASLLASEIQELVSTILQWRAKHLRESIQNLLSGGYGTQESDEMSGFIEAIYSDPLIKNMNQSSTGLLASLGRNIYRFFYPGKGVFGKGTTAPSYISAETFATALLEQMGLSTLVDKLTEIRLEKFITRIVGLYDSTETQKAIGSAATIYTLTIPDEKSFEDKDNWEKGGIRVLAEKAKSLGQNPEQMGEKPSPLLDLTCNEDFKALVEEYDDILRDFRAGEADLETCVERMREGLDLYINQIGEKIPADSGEPMYESAGISSLSQVEKNQLTYFKKRLLSLRLNTFGEKNERAITAGKLKPSLLEIAEVFDRTSATYQEIESAYQDIATAYKAGADPQEVKTLVDQLVAKVNAIAKAGSSGLQNGDIAALPTPSPTSAPSPPPIAPTADNSGAIAAPPQPVSPDPISPTPPIPDPAIPDPAIPDPTAPDPTAPDSSTAPSFFAEPGALVTDTPPTTNEPVAPISQIPPFNPDSPPVTEIPPSVREPAAPSPKVPPAARRMSRPTASVPATREPAPTTDPSPSGDPVPTPTRGGANPLPLPPLTISLTNADVVKDDYQAYVNSVLSSLSPNEQQSYKQAYRGWKIYQQIVLAVAKDVADHLQKQTRLFNSKNQYLVASQKQIPEDNRRSRKEEYIIQPLKDLDSKALTDTVKYSLSLMSNEERQLAINLALNRLPLEQRKVYRNYQTYVQIQDLLSHVPASVKQSLAILARRAQTKVQQTERQINQFRNEVSTWFDRSMNRASGVYKRNAKGVALMIGFIIALIANADTFHIIARLSGDGNLRQVITARAGEITQQVGPNATGRELTVEDLRSIKNRTDAVLQEVALPLQWTPSNLIRQFDCLDEGQPTNLKNQPNPVNLATPLLKPTDPNKWSSFYSACLPPNRLAKLGDAAQTDDFSLPLFGEIIGRRGVDAARILVGWMVSGVAIAMGAPFWFDLLSKLMNVRNTGAKPASTTDKDPQKPAS